MVKLQTPPAGGPHTLSIKGENSIEITNVLSGEIWLCSGQSNMDFSLKMLSSFRKQVKPKSEDRLNLETR